MKKATLVLIMLAMAFAGYAQGDDKDVHISHYIFKDFIAGLVKKKQGQAHLSLNYNILTGEMIFLKDTQKLAIANLDEIDTVYVGGKIFVPAKNVFYEKATNTPVALYIDYRATVMPPGSNVGYGMTSQSGSVADLSALIGAMQVYKLTLPDGYRVVQHATYLLYKDGKYIQVTNVKRLQAVFPAKAAAIKDFVQANNIKLDNRDDMLKLVVFCNQPG